MRWLLGWAKKKRNKQKFRMQSESLEDRQLLAGDVFVNVSSAGDLVITGDAEANQISVMSDGENISVYADGDTSVWSGDTGVSEEGDSYSSGYSVEIPVASVTGKLTIDTKGGDDTVHVSGDFSEMSTSVATGSGDDATHVGYGRGIVPFEYSGNLFSDLTIDVGTGSDLTTMVGAYVSGNVSIKTGFSSEADSVFADGGYIEGDLTIHTGGAAGSAYCDLYSYGYRGGYGISALEEGDYEADVNDFVRLGNQHVGGNLSISGNGGGQCVRVDYSSVEGNTAVHLGPGDDSLLLSDTTLSGDLLSTMSSGDDSVNISYYSYLYGDASILVGAGDDGVGVESSYLYGALRIHGGSGNNYTDLYSSYLNETLITGGGNEDTVFFGRNYSGGELRVLAGGGDDELTLEGWEFERYGYYGGGYVGSHYGNVIANTGGGEDTIEMKDLRITGNVELNTAGGGDTIEVDNVRVEGNLDVAAGSGNDDVSLSKLNAPAMEFDGPEIANDAGAAANLDVQLSAGSDSLSIVDSFIPGETAANTGSGLDEVHIADNEFHGPAEIGLGGGRDAMTVAGCNVFNGDSRFVGGAGFDRLIANPAMNSLTSVVSLRLTGEPDHPDDHVNTPGEGATLTPMFSRFGEGPQGRAEGCLAQTADQDVFQFTLDELSNVTIAVDGVQTLDMAAQVFDQEGTVVATNDDFGSETDALVRAVLPAGTYFVAAASPADQLGKFDLSISATPLPIEIAEEGSTLTISGAVGDLGPEGSTISTDHDGISVAQEGGTYTLTFDAADADEGTYLVEITAADDNGSHWKTAIELIVENAAPSIDVNTESVQVVEGGTIENSGTYADQGGDSVTIWLGEESPGQLSYEDGTWDWSLETTGEDQGTHNVTVYIMDADEAMSSVSFEVVVENGAPEIDVDGQSVTVIEGTTAEYGGSYSDPGGDEVTVTLDEESPGELTYEDGDWSWSLGATGEDQGTQTVTVHVTDADEASSSVSFDVVVENAAPSISVNTESINVYEGSTAENGGTYSDQGGDDVTISLGAGSPGQLTYEDGDWSWTYDATDADEGTHTVTVNITDADEATSSVSFDVVVENAAPAIDVNTESINVYEGSAAENGGTYSDQGGDDVTVSLGAGSPGQLTYEDGDWSWTYDATDADEGTHTVTVRIVDADEASSSVSFDVVVENAAPSIDVNAQSVNVDEGSTVENGGTYSDQGGDDVTVWMEEHLPGQLTYADGVWSWSHNTTGEDEGTHTVTVNITDADEATSSVSFDVVVENAAPAIDVNTESINVDEGSAAANGGTYSDPGGDDVTISLDEDSPGQLTYADGTWSWSLDTTGEDEETHSVTVNITDADEATSSVSFDVVVENAAPAIDVNTESINVYEGSTAVNGGTYSDPGGDDVTISLDEDSLGQLAYADGSWSWTYDATDADEGTHTVTVNASDGQGGESSTSFDVVVENVAPMIATDGASALIEYTFSGEIDWISSQMYDEGVPVSFEVGTEATGSFLLDGDVTPNINGQRATYPSAFVNAVVNIDDYQFEKTGTADVLINDDYYYESYYGSEYDYYQDRFYGYLTTGESAPTTVENGMCCIEFQFQVQDSVAPGSIDGLEFPTSIEPTQFDYARMFVGFNTGKGLTIPLDSISGAPLTPEVVVAQGETATASGTFSDPGNDIVNVSLAAASPGVLTQSDGTWSWSLDTTGVAGGTQTVEVMIEDASGATASTSFDLVTVVNAAPVIAAEGNATTVFEGETAEYSGTFSDPEGDSVTISVADGSPGTVTQNDDDGTWSWSYTTQGGADESGTVTILATDENGAVSEVDFELEVVNVAPTIAVDDVSLDDASLVGLLEYAFTGEVTYASTLNDNGQPVTVNVGDPISGAVYVDGTAEPSSLDLTARQYPSAVTRISAVVGSREFHSAGGTSLLQIDNDRDFGGFSDTFYAFTNDSSGATTIGGGVRSMTFRLDDYGITPSSALTSVEIPTSLDASLFSNSSLAISLNSGGVNATISSTSASNVSPTVTVNEGATATVTGTFSDVVGDDVTVTVADGSLGEVTQNDDGTWEWSHEATAADEGTHTVTINIEDADGGQSSTSFSLIVEAPVGPTVLAIAYTDVDPDDGDGYKAGTDVMIAQFEDTNENGQPDVGDTVVTNQYPTSFEATAFADFDTTSHVVTEINVANEMAIISIHAGNNWTWFDSSGYYYEVGSGSATFIADQPSGPNVISVYAGSPSMPSTFVETGGVEDSNDDGFIDVDFLWESGS